MLAKLTRGKCEKKMRCHINDSNDIIEGMSHENT